MYRGGLPERLTAKHTAQPHGHSVLTSIITFSGKREGKGEGCSAPFTHSAEKSQMVFFHALLLRSLSPAGRLTASKEKALSQNSFQK